jgi:hypothetical protein
MAGPLRRDKPALIPMYAENIAATTSTETVPQPPAFSCTPILCVASCERFSDCPPLLSAHFLTPTTGTCQAPQATPVERGATELTGHRQPTATRSRQYPSESQDAAAGAAPGERPVTPSSG